VFEPGRIVTVGTLSPKKGHDVLIRAVARLGGATELEIIGEGPERARLQALSAELGVQTTFSGALDYDTTLARVGRAHVFALCCRETSSGDHDCLPIALMDAMSLGVPCVSSNAFGIPELIDDGRSGLLAAQGDDLAVSIHLERLLSDPGIRSRIGREGRATVRQHYDLEKNLDVLAELFRTHLT
jgi:glycosyltransferase involved in cell wall biosynthesis